MSTPVPVETEINGEEYYAEALAQDEDIKDSTSNEPFCAEAICHTTTDVGNLNVGPPTWNIFVGDLGPDVVEQDLMESFSSCGPIHLVNIIKNNSGQCKGFAFIHFLTPEAQKAALAPASSTCVIRNRLCRVKPSDHKDTLFVGSIPIDLTQEQVTECIKFLCKEKVAENIQVILKTGPPPQFRSRGFCFVKFTSHVHAEAGKKILTNATIKGRPLNISWATSDTREIGQDAMEKVTTLFVSNVSASVTEDSLRTLFSQFGDVAKCVIVKYPHSGEPRGFSFIEFAERDPCVKAIEGLDGEEFFGQVLSVVLAKPPPVSATKTRFPTPARGQRRGGVFPGRGSFHYRGGGSTGGAAGGTGPGAGSGGTSGTTGSPGGTSGTASATGGTAGTGTSSGPGGTNLIVNSATGEQLQLTSQQFAALKQVLSQGPLWSGGSPNTWANNQRNWNQQQYVGDGSGANAMWVANQQQGGSPGSWNWNQGPGPWNWNQQDQQQSPQQQSQAEQ